MTTITDLPWDLVEEILIKIPLTCLGKVRSTCKRWNSSSKDRILFKSEAKQQFLGFMVNNFGLCSVRFDLHGILDDDVRAVASIKQIAHLVNHVKLLDVFYCDGLLLCVTKNKTSLVVWNPYLGQTRLIQPRCIFHSRIDRYALGYDKDHNHKILRYFRVYDYKAKQIMDECEVYDFKSHSWRVLDTSPEWDIVLDKRGVSLKGNAYFFARVKSRLQEDYGNEVFGLFLLGFDFTKESFGQFLHLPGSHHDYYDSDTRLLSSLRDEKLAVLFQNEETYEVDIWVTSKIQVNEVSWNKFLNFNVEVICGIGIFGNVSFYIEEEKNLAVVFDVVPSEDIANFQYYNTATICGENGYWEEVDLGAAVNPLETLTGSPPDPCPIAYSSSYVPSLVQINQLTGAGYREEKKRKRNN